MLASVSASASLPLPLPDLKCTFTDNSLISVPMSTQSTQVLDFELSSTLGPLLSLRRQFAVGLHDLHLAPDVCQNCLH